MRSGCLIDYVLIRILCWHLVSEWISVLGKVNPALSQMIFRVKPAYILKLFRCMWCPQRFCSEDEKKVKGGHACSSVSSGILPRAKGLSTCDIISMSFGVILKRKTLACGLQVGHIQITLWVNGSSESTSVTHFKPCHTANNMVWLINNLNAIIMGVAMYIPVAR